VYDTAWQMFARATVSEADEYFEELKDQGFSGAWAAVISHAPSTYNHTYPGGGNVGAYTNGEIVLSPGYIAHVNAILDKADDHGMKVGLVVAWQNLYLPGGLSDEHVPASDLVRGTLTTANAYAYGEQMVDAFGSHPAVNAWIFGGDSGTNNTAANITVWEIMADAIDDKGSTLDKGIHLPPYEFDSLLYADVDFLDFAAPEIGHNKTPSRGQWEMEQAVAAYDIPVWMGEARYFNNDFLWLPEVWRNPGAAEMAADAQASKDAGVSGYLYGDSGRWNWCAGYGDSTPCDQTNIADSFGPGEAAALAVFEAGQPPVTTTTTTTTTTILQVDVEFCGSRVVTVDFNKGQRPTSGDDVILGTPGNDFISAGAGDDVVCAGGGDDIVRGGDGMDRINGEDGHDVLHGDDGRDRLAGGTGNDELHGGQARDVLHGNKGADQLSGDSGRDRINGSAGADVLIGGGGNDRLSGGLGTDTAQGGLGDDRCVSVETRNGCERILD
jgi:Ca2+-binding RTX toxin-like protein